MVGVQKQAGFTLIELILTMAISSALTVIALTGFSSTRADAQFRDSIERTTTAVIEARTEINATVQVATSTATPNYNTDNITVGRLLTFTPGSSDITVMTLQTANNPTDPASTNLIEVSSNSYTYKMPWGIVYNGQQRQDVVFYRSPFDITASLHTAMSSPGGYPLVGAVTKSIAYSSLINPSNPQTLALPLSDGSSNRTAMIHFDSSSNGVTRTFQ